MNINARAVLKPTILGAVIVTLTYPAYASSNFSLAGMVGLEAQSNAGLTSRDEQSDTKRSVSADVGYKKNDGELLADIDYQAGYGSFVHGVQSDQTSINGRGALTWLIAPSRLDAVLTHQISQQLTDRRGLDVANNREERSILTTGFDGFLHMSPVDSLILAPRFTDVHFQQSNNSDSKRSSMATTWDHKVSRVSALDLKANYDDVKFDDSVNDYSSPNLMLSFSTALSRLSYEIGLGASRINRDKGKDVSGSSATAVLNYHGDAGQDWGASYIRRLTDSSIGLSSAELQVTSFRSNDSNFAQVDIIQEDKFDTYWRDHISASGQLELNAGYQREDYKTTPRDQNVTYAHMGYQYSINSRWSAGIDARFDRTKFVDDPKQKYDTTSLYLKVSYRPSRPLEVRFSIGQDKRDADTSGASYTNDVALAELRYRFF